MEDYDLQEALPAEFTREVELIPFYAAKVPKALCGELLKMLQPLGEDLKHLKRVRPEGANLVVLLGEKTDLVVQKFLQEHESTSEVVQVPRFSPLTAWQMESCMRYWPVKKLVPSFQPLKLTEELKAHFARCLALVREAGGCVVADAAGRVLAVATGEVTPRAPLQHPAMVAIEKVAEEARKRSSGKRSREDDAYLCQDCDVVLTMEPCIMCAMALVHSRVKRVAFWHSDMEFGGFGGRLALHQCQSLNHTVRVLQWQQKRDGGLERCLKRCMKVG